MRLNARTGASLGNGWTWTSMLTEKQTGKPPLSSLSQNESNGYGNLQDLRCDSKLWLGSHSDPYCGYSSAKSGHVTNCEALPIRTHRHCHFP